MSHLVSLSRHISRNLYWKYKTARTSAGNLIWKFSVPNLKSTWYTTSLVIFSQLKIICSRDDSAVPICYNRSLFYRLRMVFYWEGMSWHSGVSCHHMVPVWALTVLLPIRLPDNGPGKDMNDDSNTSATVICMGDLDGVTASAWPRPGHFSHLKSKLVYGNFVSPPPLSNTAFQINMFLKSSGFFS